MSIAVGWAPIVKAEKREDGTLVITGKAADSTVDRDYQIADEAWLDGAMSKWFTAPDGGNIREQHNPQRAIGNAVHYEKRDGGHFITAEIVDPVAIAKIERKVLKGFSWSARNAAITTDKAAPGGRIVKGDIYELSVVDRPANPGCLISIAKADSNGDLQLVDSPQVVEVVDKVVNVGGLVNEPRFTPNQFADLLKSLGKGMGGTVTAPVSHPDEVPVVISPAGELTKSEDDGCPKCGADVAAADKYCANCGQKLAGGKDTGAPSKADDLVAMYGEDLTKFVGADKRKEYADKGVALPNGDFPIPDEGHLKSAIGHLGNYDGDKAKAKAHIIKRARALKLTNLLPAEWGVSKAFDTIDALRKQLDDAGINVSKVDAAAAEQEAGDVSDSKAAIAAIARLIIAEAEELAEGHLGEIQDIQMLIGAACALRCFIDSEADEIASHSAPTEASAMKTDKTDAPTEPDTSTTETETVTSKTEAAPQGELTKTDLSEMLDAAITKAVQPYKDELDAVKGQLAKVLETPRPDGPARTRTSTHTAVATKADTLRKEIAYCKQQTQVTSGDLQKGYRERMEQAEDELLKLDGAAA
ncbi:zinc ribbon domain-containing protein [Actinocrispum wychmicini]|uniref:Prohead serine protease n=1 Tax=Actinocrispum wychmicini TaxID=1213861 RepID=A0A4R2JC66_9PSEU|nr:zinc ribbon domain-containing protein [Actinocrispum wychmicini]TCO57131.1 hypothetical protein EV192_106608 [Actinocrispum wychmicini]